VSAKFCQLETALFYWNQLTSLGSSGPTRKSVRRPRMPSMKAQCHGSWCMEVCTYTHSYINRGPALQTPTVFYIFGFFFFLTAVHVGTVKLRWKFPHYEITYSGDPQRVRRHLTVQGPVDSKISVQRSWTWLFSLLLFCNEFDSWLNYHHWLESLSWYNVTLDVTPTSPTDFNMFYYVCIYQWKWIRVKMKHSFFCVSSFTGLLWWLLHEQ